MRQRHHQLAVYYYAIALCVTLRITFCAGAGSDESGGIKRDVGAGVQQEEDEHSAQQQQLIPLTKCCEIGEFYNAGFDRCLEWENYLMDSHDDATSFLQVPPFYHDDDGRGGVHPVAPSAFLLSFNNNLTFCPNGHIVKSTTDFQLFKNGSMKTVLKQGTNVMQKSGEFCIDRIMSQENFTSSSSAMFVSRFCIADPCANNRTGCVHKCCPNGMALNETERICQQSSVPFEIPFHGDENGVDPVDRELLASSLVISDGVFVDCKHGAFSLRPSVEVDDEFYILADGRIRAPALDDYNDDYCIDNFVNEDGVVRILFEIG